MPGREPATGADVCELATRWRVAPDTMGRVQLAAAQFEQETGRRVDIISGYRTQQQQAQLGRAGRPTAAEGRSTHRSCPATGVDVSLGVLPSNFLKATWGRITLIHGLRWGGGGELDPRTGIPLDWGHVDRGPRN